MSLISFFPDVSVGGSKSRRVEALCVSDSKESVKEELFTAVMKKCSIYTCTCKKITSCISLPLTTLLTAFLIYNIYTIYRYIYISVHKGANV